MVLDIIDMKKQSLKSPLAAAPNLREVTQRSY